jgi:hypothetical protein
MAGRFHLLMDEYWYNACIVLVRTLARVLFYGAWQGSAWTPWCINKSLINKD